MTTLGKIKRIKYLRMKPEERFLADILSGIKVGYNNKHSYSTFYTKKNKILFEYTNRGEEYKKRFDCRHSIWDTLQTKYKLTFGEMQSLFLSNEILKLDGRTLVTTISNIEKGAWDSLKITYD